MKIKICGITNWDDAACAIDAGADLLGFIFYPESLRYVFPDKAAEIIARLPGEVDTVGVFVNEPAETLLDVAKCAGLSTIQLHGHEPESIVDDLGAYRLMKAFAVQTEDDLQKLSTFQDAIALLDTPCPEWGGSGRTGDWELARTAAERRDIFLAGGLRPENVEAAIREVRPYGLDVSTGVELTKVKKDHARIKEFIRLARATEKELGL